MSHRLISILFSLLAWALTQADEVRFNRDVRPILAEHCLACHGADDDAREADLRLDIEQSALASEAFIPGQPENSQLIDRIYSNDPDQTMPPPGHAELSDEHKQTLTNWIKQGATYETHWSFSPPIQPVVPPVPKEFNNWPNNPIDHFVLRRLIDHDLTPSEEASKYTLIRRLYLDLTGLPPTPQEADAFVVDTAANAYERVVDRLLASEHFGEHWARMWLDLARYADTKGYEKDRHRDMWRYRDWVIEAFNADMPFDQFTLEQLAGDLLPDPAPNQILATAFHRNTMTNDEGGTDNEEFRSIAVKDRVDTTMQVWMGLTMGCAKCHSHKYDPISQEEYYEFYSFFNQTEDADRGDEAPKIKTPSRIQTLQLASFNHRLQTMTSTLANLSNNTNDEQSLQKQIDELKSKRDELAKSISSTPIMKELEGEKRRETYVHIRGNFLEKGAAVTSSTPKEFGEFPADAPQNRVGVALWLTQSNNPLTSRVAVNRVWSRIFGKGIVETEEDFGSQGAYPTHPDLLDWLAVQFRDELNGSHKELCKLIVMSTTYRQSSKVTAHAAMVDPDNRLWGRAPRYRLPAETIRDQALVAAGLLTREIGGPSVMPPQPKGIWKTTYSSAKWIDAVGPQRFRRGIYTYWRRTSPYPAMMTFDAGSREVCMVRRIRTNIPLQALITMNDPVYVEAAGALAESVLDTANRLDEHRMADAFQRVLVRMPTKSEVARLLAMLAEAKGEYQQDPQATQQLLEAAARNNSHHSPHELAAWTVVGNVLLNLDETLMRN